MKIIDTLIAYLAAAAPSIIALAIILIPMYLIYVACCLWLH